jgi:hypothetical protein
MSEIERFDVLVFGSGAGLNSLPGPVPVNVCRPRSWNAASSGDHARILPACRRKT